MVIHPYGCFALTRLIPLYFPAFFLSVPFSHFSDEQQPELYKKDMETLCDSVTKGYEPKAHDFDELQKLSVPLLLEDLCRGPGRG